MDSENTTSKSREIKQPNSIVDFTEEDATGNSDNHGSSRAALAFNDHSKSPDSSGNRLHNPVSGLLKDDDFPRFKIPSVLTTKAYPTDELSEESTWGGLSRGNSITLDAIIPRDSSTGLTRLNSFSGILRELSWSSQSSNIDALLYEEGGNTANSRNPEISVDASTRAIGISSTAATTDSRKRKDLPGEGQPDQTLKSIFKSSKSLSALGPIIPRDVTMGLGFNFSKGIPRESSWSNSDLALSQELKDIDSTSSGRSFDILAAVASAISTNDHPTPPSPSANEQATNTASVPVQKVSIASAADIISSNQNMRHDYRDPSVSTYVQNPMKVRAGAEKDGILGERRLQSLFGNFK